MALNDVLISLGIEATNLNGLNVYFDESKQLQQLNKGAKRSKGGQNLAAMAVKERLENKYNFKCEKIGYIEAVKLQKRKTKAAKEAIVSHFAKYLESDKLFTNNPLYMAYIERVNKWHKAKLNELEETYFVRIK